MDTTSNPARAGQIRTSCIYMQKRRVLLQSIAHPRSCCMDEREPPTHTNICEHKQTCKQLSNPVNYKGTRSPECKNLRVKKTQENLVDLAIIKQLMMQLEKRIRDSPPAVSPRNTKKTNPNQHPQQHHSPPWYSEQDTTVQGRSSNQSNRKRHKWQRTHHSTSVPQNTNPNTCKPLCTQSPRHR